MKKTILIIAAFISGFAGFGQSKPNNVDLGVFPNGMAGSNGSSGADMTFALRIKPGGLGYTASPAAEDLFWYLRLPSADYSLTDNINIVQNNTAIMGTSGTIVFQGIFDVGDPGYVWAGFALFAPGGMNLSSLSAVSNAWVFTTSFSFSPAKTPTQLNGIRVVDQLNGVSVGAWSQLMMSGVNQLTNSGYVLPVDMLSFSGYKDGTRNQLRWTTTTEMNNKGFEVQRSLDGVTYNSIGFVNSLAPGGSSTNKIDYTYTDNNVTGSRQFYRLRQVDFDGRSKLSNIVLLKSDKPTLITLDGMFPNPAVSVVNMMIASPVKDKVLVTLVDMSGRTVLQKQLNVETGSNTIPVDVSGLAGGAYMVRLQSGNGEVSTGKLVKQ